MLKYLSERFATQTLHPGDYLVSHLLRGYEEQHRGSFTAQPIKDMIMKTDPWNAILVSYAQTGTLPPCPFCSQDALTAEQNNSCAHIGGFIYCSNCGKWTHADGNLGKAQSMD